MHVALSLPSFNFRANSVRKQLMIFLLLYLLVHDSVSRVY